MPRQSASSGDSSSQSAERYVVGKTPWVASIGGGPHTSYTGIGLGERQPQLAKREEPNSSGVRLTSTSQLGDSDVMSRDPEQVAHGEEEPRDQSRRKLVMCPHFLANGYCRLPSCPYVHEVYRHRKEKLPLFGANAS